MHSLQFMNKLNYENNVGNVSADVAMKTDEISQKPEIKLKPMKIYDRFTMEELENFNLSDCEMKSEEEYSQEYSDDRPKNNEITNKSDNSGESLQVKGNTAFKSLIKACGEMKGKIKINTEDFQLTKKPCSIAEASLSINHKFGEDREQESMVGLLTKQERSLKVKRYLDK